MRAKSRHYTYLAVLLAASCGTPPTPAAAPPGVGEIEQAVANFSRKVVWSTSGCTICNGDGYRFASPTAPLPDLTFSDPTPQNSLVKSMTVGFGYTNCSFNATSASMYVNGLFLGTIGLNGYACQCACQTTNFSYSNAGGVPNYVYGGNNTVHVVLNGNGASVAVSDAVITLSATAPMVTVNPGTFDFGNVRLGASPSTTVTLTNSGDAIVKITGVTGVTAPFTLSGINPPLTIQPSSNATVTVGFKPTVTGGASNTITFATTDPGNPNLTVTVKGNGVVSKLSPSLSSVDFGSVRVGSTAVQPIVITNSGFAPLTIGTSSVVGSATFTTTGLAATTVQPGATSKFDISFAPTAAGAISAALNINSDDPNTPSVINLKGTGVVSKISITPSPIDFGQVRLGMTSPQKTITIANGGTATLNITGSMVTGPFAAQGLTSGGVTPGTNKTFTMTFTPLIPGDVAGTLVITSDDPGNPTTTISITGTGSVSQVTTSANPVKFGDVDLGNTSTVNINLSNSGTAALSISSLAILGANAADFTNTTQFNYPFMISAGGSIPVSIQFKPSTHGTASAQLTVGSDAYQNTVYSVNLTGNGVGPKIAVTPTTVMFDSINVKDSAPAKSITISNSGEKDLKVTGIMFSGSAAGDFSTSLSFPIIIPTGNMVQAPLSFSPMMSGTRTAQAIVVSNDTLNPGVMVSVSGQATQPAIAVTPTTVDFGSVTIGTTSAATGITINNNGDGPLNIASVTVTGMDAALYKVTGVATPLAVMPMGSTTLMVAFSPIAVAASMGSSLTILSDDPAMSNIQIPLTGKGVSSMLALSATSLDFGAQLIGHTSAPRSIDVSNTGTAPLNVSMLTVGGAQAMQFTLVNPPALPLAVMPGAKQTLTLTLNPTMMGAQMGQLLIATDDPMNMMAKVSLAGMGVSTAIVVTPAMIDFGTLRVGVGSMAMPIMITNGSADSVVLVDGVLDGMNSGDFTVSAVAGQLAAGKSITAMVTYKPSKAASATATLTFAATDKGVPAGVVMLKGAGVGSTIAVAPTALDFGLIQVGMKSSTKMVTVTNQSTSPITIMSVTSGDPQFIVDSSAIAMPIAGGMTGTFSVTYQPANGTRATSQVSVTLQGAMSAEAAVDVTGIGQLAGKTPGGGCDVARGTGGPASLPLAAAVLFLGAAFTLAARRRPRGARAAARR